MDPHSSPVVRTVIVEQTPQVAPAARVSKPLDPSRFVVLGEGLAAGMANFSLMDCDQRESFGAQMARQMKVAFAQPLIQPPGLGDAPGFPRLPVRLPFDHQTTVLTEFPPTAPYGNLSVPGLTLAEAVSRRPATPLISADDARQTAINMILGLPALPDGQAPVRTQLETAIDHAPTLAVIALGYAEVLEAATTAQAAEIPDDAVFRAHYATVVSSLRAIGCDVIVTTIPDPMDTAHFSTSAAAARVVKMPAALLEREYNLDRGGRATVNGLMEIGYRRMEDKPAPLPAGSVLRGTVAAEITRRVQLLNNAIVSVAAEHGALVYDLGGFFRRLNTQGLTVGARKLTSDFLGGFYSLNGYYPGKTGQALIANELLTLINRSYGTTFATIDVTTVIGTDPVADYKLADGPDYSTMGGFAASAVATIKHLSTMAGFLMNMVVDTVNKKKTPPPRSTGCHPEQWTLKLPSGLAQELPVNKAASYYGDALRPVHTDDTKEAEYGLTGRLLFGGLAMLDTHLSGTVRITFTPPVNDITTFEVTHGSTGLVGDDSRLSAPQFFCMPAIKHQVMDSVASPSTGKLNLITGDVTDLKFNFFFLNSAILSLAAVNPALPRDPIKFPGEYGSTHATFEQRPDGRLDYSCYATTFIPLSVLKTPIRFPLPFTGPSGSFAHIPSDGTALHPHIHLSTKPLERPDPDVEVPAFPVNTIQMFTAPSHNNHFGDDFALNTPELGGPGTGRSHLVGRYQIQFGERFGNAQQFSIITAQPGGLMTTLPQTVIAKAFGKRVPDSLLGHEEWLRFHKQTYNNDRISWLDDPLDLAVGVIDLKTGKVIGGLLRRGMISTSWILAMIEVEPRTPRATFMFRGPAGFTKSTHGQTRFWFHGDLHIPFPLNFNFPTAKFTAEFAEDPDAANAAPGMKSFQIGPNSALDPYLRFSGVHVPGAHVFPPRRGGSTQMTSLNGTDFAYQYELVPSPGVSTFEFTNITLGATFKMTRLTWVDFLNSATSAAAEGDYDTFTFTGFGTWSDDPSNGIHIATVHISTSPTHPFVSVLIDGGVASNVETRPPDRQLTHP